MSNKPDEKKYEYNAKNVWKIGTPECALFLAGIAMLVAVLLLIVGFWGTVLIVALMALGAFIGGVKDKKASLQAFINRVFPAREPAAPVKTDKDEAIEKLYREKIKETKQEDSNEQ